MNWWRRTLTPRDTLALERIASALERMAPVPEQGDGTPAEPSGADYVDEAKMATYEEAERLGATARLLAHMEEQARAEAELAAQDEQLRPYAQGADEPDV